MNKQKIFDKLAVIRENLRGITPEDSIWDCLEDIESEIVELMEEISGISWNKVREDLNETLESHSAIINLEDDGEEVSDLGNDIISVFKKHYYGGG